MKKLILFGLLVAISQPSMAYTPFVLSPKWIKSVYQSYAEDNKNVWRGEVIAFNGGVNLTIKTLGGQDVEVTLIHLASKRESSAEGFALGNAYLHSLVGKQVYVLGSENKSKIYAKILDSEGEDLNLTFVSQGIFDVNTTSLLGKREKGKYLAAVNKAKKLRIGIWGGI